MEGAIDFYCPLLVLVSYLLGTLVPTDVLLVQI